MAGKLSGKAALVTGASKGIGASVAKHLAAEGATVVVNYSSSKAGADKVVSEITAKGGKAVAIQANVAKEADVRRLFAEAKKAVGTIDILVNNAGIYEWLPLDAITADHFHKQFDLNVLGLLLVSQEAARQFSPKGGTIVNVSSGVSTFAPPNSAVYSATKGAVDTITRVLAKELGPKVRVNAINPGLIDTEGVQAMDGEKQFKQQIEAIATLKRVGEAHEIAKAVVFLASDDSSYVTGQTLFATGGL